MQHLDVQVIEQAKSWLEQGHTIWLSTVLSTFGSSPRAPGSLMVADIQGRYCGSLSGGCVEEDFLEQISMGNFNCNAALIHYGGQQTTEVANHRNISLPCGGVLEVLVERMLPTPEVIQQITTFLSILTGQNPHYRSVSLQSGFEGFRPDTSVGAQVIHDEANRQIKIRVGPASRLIIAGISPVSEFCAQYAQMLGFEVIICDPRDDACANFKVEKCRVEQVFPADFLLREGTVHSQTAIVALTHDPRIDDLAILDALSTEAFYIGVIGSLRTSQNRAERLKRTGGLTNDEINRIHMPVGLNLGSKTPAEIGLAVMADILRTLRGIDSDSLIS